jgi:cation diffusion facilitator family transporter
VVHGTHAPISTPQAAAQAAMTRLGTFATAQVIEKEVEAVDRAQRIGIGSIAVSLAALAMKGIGWWLTGSAAIFSDAAETFVNVVASALTVFALSVAVRPADVNHPFGHAKAEFFAAAIEGGLIVGAALAILHEAWQTWRLGALPQLSWFGIGLTLLGAVLNGAWAAVLFRVGKRERSPALVADGRHLFTDVVTSFGVVGGVLVGIGSGIVALDPLFAALVAAYILVSGYRLIRASVGGLMDEAIDESLLARIRKVVSEQGVGAIEAHDLRTRSAGRDIFLEFHLVVPAKMTVAEAHEICDRIEAALRAEIPGLTTTIHIEPEGKAKHHGVIVL